MYAVAWAAATVPLIMTAGFAVATLLHGGDFNLFAIVYACATAFVIGWPCALLCGALVALAFGKGVLEGNRPASIGAVVLATVLGYFGVSMVWTSFDEVIGYGQTMSVAGAIAGLVAGICFCYLARLDTREFDSRRRSIAPYTSTNNQIRTPTETD